MCQLLRSYNLKRIANLDAITAIIVNSMTLTPWQPCIMRSISPAILTSLFHPETCPLWTDVVVSDNTQFSLFTHIERTLTWSVPCLTSRAHSAHWYIVFNHLFHATGTHFLSQLQTFNAIGTHFLSQIFRQSTIISCINTACFSSSPHLLALRHSRVLLNTKYPWHHEHSLLIAATWCFEAIAVSSSAYSLASASRRP